MSTNDENIRSEIMVFIESIVDSPSDLLKILSNLVIKNHQLVIGLQSNVDGRCGISTLIRLLEGVCRDDVKFFREFETNAFEVVRKGIFDYCCFKIW